MKRGAAASVQEDAPRKRAKRCEEDETSARVWVHYRLDVQGHEPTTLLGAFECPADIATSTMLEKHLASNVLRRHGVETTEYNILSGWWRRRDHETVHVSCLDPRDRDPTRVGFQMFCKTLTGACKTFDMCTHSTVEDLKRRVQESEGIEQELIRLIFAGKQLEDGRLLVDYNIRSETTVHLCLRLTGNGHPTEAEDDPDTLLRTERPSIEASLVGQDGVRFSYRVSMRCLQSTARFRVVGKRDDFVRVTCDGKRWNGGGVLGFEEQHASYISKTPFPPGSTVRFKIDADRLRLEQNPEGDMSADFEYVWHVPLERPIFLRIPRGKAPDVYVVTMRSTTALLEELRRDVLATLDLESVQDMGPILSGPCTKDMDVLSLISGECLLVNRHAPIFPASVKVEPIESTACPRCPASASPPPIGVAFSPCNHILTCSTCNLLVTKCPFCNAPIQSRSYTFATRYVGSSSSTSSTSSSSSTSSASAISSSSLPSSV